MEKLLEVIIDLFLSVIKFILSAIWTIISWIFSFFCGFLNGRSEQRVENKLKTLLIEIEKKQKEVSSRKKQAMEVINLVEDNSQDCTDVKELIDYCTETEKDLNEDRVFLKRAIDTLTSENIDVIEKKGKTIRNHISSIKYPVDVTRLKEIERNATSGSRFIDSLLNFAKVNDLTKTGVNKWSYTTSKMICNLDYDEESKLIKITASPKTMVRFEDNPRHPWQYSEPDTLAYFNPQHELEFQVTRKISEIDHYDVDEIFNYMLHLISKKDFNEFANKNVLSYNEAGEIDCNVFPKLNNEKLVPTAPPPADFIPDSEKMHGGKQRWAQLSDVESAGMLQEEGFMIGKIGYGSYLYTGEYDSHILTIASVGSGKGTGVVIPNLLRHKGSTVVLDPKGENLMTTAHKRSLMGNKVYYYDPWNVIDFYDTKYNKNVVPDAIKAQINPLDFILPDSPNFADNARKLAAAMILRTDPQGDFFYNGAESLLSQLIVYICSVYSAGNQNRNLVYLRELLTMAPKDLLHNELEPNYNKVIANGETPHRMFSELISWLRTNIDARPRSFNDIYTFALQGTAFLTSPVVEESIKKSNIDILKLKTSPTSLYLVLDMDKLLFVRDLYKPLVRVIFTTCMFGASTMENAQYKLLFMLDEIAQLGNLQWLPDLMSIYRSRGVVVWTIWQNLEQIQKNYEKDWQTMIGNCDVQQFFGVNDQTTAEYVSKLAGNTTIYKESYAITEGESRGDTIAQTFSDQTGWSKSSSSTYQGFNFSTTNEDSKSISDSISGGNSYSFSRSIQISTSYSKGRTLTKECVPLITPYEVKAGSGFGVQFVFYGKKCSYPILSGKIKYYQDLEFDGESSENLTRSLI